MSNNRSRSGTSIIDLLVALGILALLFAGVFLVYFSIVDATSNVELRSAATSVLNREVEIVRNLPYDKVGTASGTPAGVIPQSQTIASGNQNFVLLTSVRNIDDPFDGTLGGTPNDTAPADYKLVSFEVDCPDCQHFVPLRFTTTVAPKNLESASSTGALYISVFDAEGIGVPQATVHITNSSVSPAIDLTDTTNDSGVLSLIGMPTSTQAYRIMVSKSGYSSDRTYPVGDASNPNPVKSDATVAAQTVTNVSFAIDRTSQLTVLTSGPTCSAYGNQGFSLSGAKLIGTSPDVLKFSTTTATDGGGSKVFNSFEWDTYTPVLTQSGYDVLGTLPLSPLALDPNTAVAFRFVVQPSDPDSLLVTVKDAGTNNGLQDAAVTLSKTGFSATQTTGHRTLYSTDWSGGAYDSQSGGMDADSVPGTLQLLVNASGTYPGGPEWLVSRTIDLGGASSTLYALTWSGSEPSGVGQNATKFQLAANNDGATWDFVGPNGSGSSYFTSSGDVPPAALNGKRYVRYKVFLSTNDGTVTPSLTNVGLEFNSVCVPPYQTLFTGLAAGTYDLQVSAAGHADATSTVTIGSSWQQTETSL